MKHFFFLLFVCVIALGYGQDFSVTFSSGKTLYFNISPGTGLISGLLTLIGVDSRHCLYYYSQITDDSISDFDRLTKIDKDLESVKKAVTEELAVSAPSVIICRRPCVLLKGVPKKSSAFG